MTDTILAGALQAAATLLAPVVVAALNRWLPCSPSLAERVGGATSGANVN